MERMTDELTSRQVCEASGLTYRQLDYWTRIGVLADDRQLPGSGNRRRWTRLDAAVLAVAAQVIALGARPSQLAPLVGLLRELPDHEWHGKLFVDPASGEVTRMPGRAAGWFVTLESYDPGL